MVIHLEWKHYVDRDLKKYIKKNIYIYSSFYRLLKAQPLYSLEIGHIP